MLQRFFGRLRIYGLSKLRAIMEPSEQGVKRPSPEETQESEENAKRQKTGSNVDRKRKCVIMFGYNGKGYFGLQRNHGFKTIELDLCQALLDAGLIPLEHFEYMHKDIIEPFKEEVILSPIYKTELEEHSMLKWLPELEGLSFIPDEENQSEELMIRREEKHLAANRFIYGPDYIAPEKTNFTKSNEAEPEMDITTKLEDCSSGGLANQKAANQGPPSDIPTNGGGEFACSAGIEKYDIKDNKQTSNVKSGVVSVEIDKDSNVNVETTKSESVLEEGAR